MRFIESRLRETSNAFHKWNRIKVRENVYKIEESDIGTFIEVNNKKVKVSSKMVGLTYIAMQGNPMAYYIKESY